MTTTVAITYRKTRDGQWVAFGPAEAIRTNTLVTVTKRDGSTKQEHVVEIGKPFDVNGRKMRYGYLAPTQTTRPTSRYGRRSCITGGNCSSFGPGRSCGAHDCDGY